MNLSKAMLLAAAVLAAQHAVAADLRAPLEVPAKILPVPTAGVSPGMQAFIASPLNPDWDKQWKTGEEARKYADVQAAGAVKGIGARQGSCRLIYAASGCVFSAVECAATTESRSGLRVTGPMGDQSRVAPDHRAGLRSRAWTYSACRAARMA
jgi:hypothetical protein